MHFVDGFPSTISGTYCNCPFNSECKISGWHDSNHQSTQCGNYRGPPRPLFTIQAVTGAWRFIQSRDYIGRLIAVHRPAVMSSVHPSCPPSFPTRIPASRPVCSALCSEVLHSLQHISPHCYAAPVTCNAHLFLNLKLRA